MMMFPVTIQVLHSSPEIRTMVDPAKLTAFDNSLGTLKASADTAAASNAAAVAAKADSDTKSSQADSDLATLQKSLDAANVAGAALGLKVNVPAA
jgi:hypothetical protein